MTGPLAGDGLNNTEYGGVNRSAAGYSSKDVMACSCLPVGTAFSIRSTRHVVSVSGSRNSTWEWEWGLRSASSARMPGAAPFAHRAEWQVQRRCLAVQGS